LPSTLMVGMGCLAFWALFSSQCVASTSECLPCQSSHTDSHLSISGKYQSTCSASYNLLGPDLTSCNCTAS
jgi:hypothetical protein